MEKHLNQLWCITLILDAPQIQMRSPRLHTAPSAWGCRLRIWQMSHQAPKVGAWGIAARKPETSPSAPSIKPLRTVEHSDPSTPPQIFSSKAVAGIFSRYPSYNTNTRAHPQTSEWRVPVSFKLKTGLLRRIEIRFDEIEKTNFG